MSVRSWIPQRGEWSAVLASAVLFALAFPPLPLVVPAFVCLVPFAIAIARRADAGHEIGSEDHRAMRRSSGRIGFWFGFIGYGLNLYWIALALEIYTKLAIVGYIAALFVLAPVVAVAGVALFVARARTRWPLAVLLPIVWVASELLLTYLLDLAFPWLPLGLATARTPVLAQAAEISGVHGLSFCIALVSGLLADAWLARARPLGARLWRVLAAGAVISAMVIYGAVRMQQVVVRDVAPVAAIQPNIPQEEKWQAEHRDQIMGILAGVTREAIARHDARLYVWPEAAIPDYLIVRPDYRDTLRVLALAAGEPIFAGALDAVRVGPNEYDMYNAALEVRADGTIDTTVYRKTYLVPIVERVPFVNPAWFRGLKYFGAFARGTSEPPLYRVAGGRFGVLICYESIFPQRARYYRANGADFLVNVTNDAWFGRSLAPYQHEAHLALRAIENRVGIIRDANTGISASVDPLGRFHGETALEVRTSRTYEAQTTDIITLYVRLGDWVGVLSALATLLLITPWARLRRYWPRSA